MSRLVEPWLAELVARALAEDLGEVGDLATRGAPWAGATWEAAVVARQDLVVSGLDWADAVSEARMCSWRARSDPGDRRARGDVIGTLTGTAADVLAIERTLLNGISRLSGIATVTARYVAAAAAGGPARVASTRKTTPGLRQLEKRATEHGGAIAHRHGLFDAAMVKDTHREAAGGIAAALDGLSLPFTANVVVEVDTLDQLEEALDAGAAFLLLDNMDLETLRDAVDRARSRPERVVLEASGGVTLDTIGDIAATGVDVVSVGAITTRAPWADVSLQGVSPP